MKSATTDIADIRNYLYRRAALLWWAAFWIAVLAQFLAMFGVWFDETVILSLAGLAALVAPIVVIWLREAANASFLRADKCRRLLLYIDGVGRVIEANDLMEVRSWTMGLTLTKASFLPPYYSSTKPPGLSRLLDNIAESAFFTSQLGDRMGRIVFRIFILSLAVLTVTLCLSGAFVATDSVVAYGWFGKFAKSAALIIALLVSGDLLLLWKKYQDLAGWTSRVFRRCGALRAVLDLREYQIMPLVEDYNIGLNQGPPIPARIYRKYMDDLNRIYRQSNSDN